MGKQHGEWAFIPYKSKHYKQQHQQQQPQQQQQQSSADSTPKHNGKKGGGGKWIGCEACNKWWGYLHSMPVHAVQCKLCTELLDPQWLSPKAQAYWRRTAKERVSKGYSVKYAAPPEAAAADQEDDADDKDEEMQDVEKPPEDAKIVLLRTRIANLAKTSASLDADAEKDLIKSIGDRKILLEGELKALLDQKPKEEEADYAKVREALTAVQEAAKHREKLQKEEKALEIKLLDMRTAVEEAKKSEEEAKDLLERLSTAARNSSTAQTTPVETPEPSATAEALEVQAQHFKAMLTQVLAERDQAAAAEREVWRQQLAAATAAAAASSAFVPEAAPQPTTQPSTDELFNSTADEVRKKATGVINDKSKAAKKQAAAAAKATPLSAEAKGAQTAGNRFKNLVSSTAK